MADKHTEELAKAAVALRAASPDAWAQFLAALELRKRAAADTMLTLPQSELPVGQGRAQETRAFLTAMERAPDTVEQYKKERANARTPSR